MVLRHKPRVSNLTGRHSLLEPNHRTTSPSDNLKDYTGCRLWWRMSLIPTAKRQRQVHLCESELQNSQGGPGERRYLDKPKQNKRKRSCTVMDCWLTIIRLDGPGQQAPSRTEPEGTVLALTVTCCNPHWARPHCVQSVNQPRPCPSPAFSSSLPEEWLAEECEVVCPDQQNLKG